MSQLGTWPLGRKTLVRTLIGPFHNYDFAGRMGLENICKNLDLRYNQHVVAITLMFLFICK